MKKIITMLVLLLVISAGYLGYRGYREYQTELAANLERRRMLAEKASLREQNRLVAAELEAHRMAELQARQAADQSAAELTRLKAEQTAVEAARHAAESARDRMQAATDQLRQAKEAAQGEARRLAELREKEAAEALRSREAALAKLRALGEDRRLEADRDAARLASLRAQQAREAELANLKPPRARIIHPFDYKPRDHHNLRSILEWEGYQKELESLQEPLKVESPADLPK